MTRPARILIAGGGYVGFYAALRLERLLQPGEADVTLVNPNSFMLYQPLLPEVASGTIEPRHATVPLRTALPRTRVLTGRLAGLDAGAHRAEVQPTDTEPLELDYDHVLVALGSTSRVLPIPGLAERGVGFKSVGEAIYLRNHVLSRLDAAAATTDHERRARALTFVVVGGGYTGVEALAELEDLARGACASFPDIGVTDLRWLLVEATDRILPTVDPELATYALEELADRGVDVRLRTTVESVDHAHVRLSTGEDVATDTVVWVAGIQPHPLLAELGLPTTDDGRLRADAHLRVEGLADVWTGGDGASVPDLVAGGTVPPTAQHAQRQGTHLGDNLAAAIRGRPARPFRFRSRGELITLGRRKGVAQAFGRNLRGTAAWALRRAYYLWQIPSAPTKLRIAADWLVGAAFRRDIVHLGPLTGPGQALTVDEPAASHPR